MDGFATLSHFADNRYTCRFEQLAKLRKVRLVLRRRDAERALFGPTFVLPCGGVLGRASAVAIALLHERRSVERGAGCGEMTRWRKETNIRPASALASKR